MLVAKTQVVLHILAWFLLKPCYTESLLKTSYGAFSFIAHAYLGS